MKNFRPILLYFVVFSMLIFNACSKNNNFLEPNLNKDTENAVNSSLFNKENISKENSIENESQSLEIINFDIKGVEVVDGRLKFADHNTLISATEELSNYNEESIIAWSKKIGFSSIFSEVVKLEQLSLSQRKVEFTKNPVNKFVELSENGEVNFEKFSHVHSRIYNLDGIIQVGEFVGTTSLGLNVWVNEEDADDLILALNEKSIPNDKKFIVLDDRIFNNNKAWVIGDNSCPKDALWRSGRFTRKNPTANRRITVRWEFRPVTTPRGGGLFDYTANFWIYSESRKSETNRYKTDHYLSIDIRTQRFNEIPTGVVTTRQNIDTGDTNSKYGDIVNNIASYSNVTSTFLENNGERLVETIPGALGSNLTGSSASHRGMGGRYVRMDCD